jgi:hypothetical protein
MHAKSRVRVTMVQLPALNTPQFDVCENRMPNQPQPVPPIYQPEIAARAIVWSADHPRRREVWVGGSATATILGNKLAAGLLDRYLARTGFKAQQTDEPNEREQASNLWEPVAGDHGAHGGFDRKAKHRSLQWWLDAHRTGVVAAAAATTAAFALMRRKR